VEGCLGGTAPNFTVTDKAGTTYRLAIPPNADTAVLTQHVGESVQVMGPVTKASQSSSTNAGASTSATSASQQSIEVAKIGRGTGTCPGSGSSAKPPAK
jgi:hypothetical protein